MAVATRVAERRMTGQGWFIVALLLVFVVLGVQYTFKALQNRSAFLRWREDIRHIESGTADYRLPNPPIMALLLRPLAAIEPAASKEDILFLQSTYHQVHVGDAILEYIIKIVDMSRGMESVEVGLSPRASQALVKAAQAVAAMRGGEFVLPDDIKAVAVPVLAHRLSLAYAAQLEKNSDSSGLGYLTMINDYGVSLGFMVKKNADDVFTVSVQASMKWKEA